MDNLQGWLSEPNAAELEQGRLRALADGARNKEVGWVAASLRNPTSKTKPKSKPPGEPGS